MTLSWNEPEVTFCVYREIQTYLLGISWWTFASVSGTYPVKFLKLLYHDQNCKIDQTNLIYFLQDLTQMCTQQYNQNCNQLLNFPVQTKNYVWLMSWCLLGMYGLAFHFCSVARWVGSDYLALTQFFAQELPKMQSRFILSKNKILRQANSLG